MNNMILENCRDLRPNFSVGFLEIGSLDKDEDVHNISSLIRYFPNVKTLKVLANVVRSNECWGMISMHLANLETVHLDDNNFEKLANITIPTVKTVKMFSHLYGRMNKSWINLANCFPNVQNFTCVFLRFIIHNDLLFNGKEKENCIALLEAIAKKWKNLRVIKFDGLQCNIRSLNLLLQQCPRLKLIIISGSYIGEEKVIELLEQSKILNNFIEKGLRIAN
jgi:hypothetical protein